MRLQKVHAGHGLKEKLILTVMAVMTRAKAPGVVRTLLYRSEFLGKQLSVLTQGAMRGDAAWTVGEREIFASFVSRLNQCSF